MRILHIDPDDIDNPLSGGGPRRTFEINRRLAARHEITVLTPSFPGSTPECIRDGVRYVRLGRRVGEHGSSHHITFFFALPRAVRRFAHDLLVEDFMPPCSVTANPLFTRAPVVGSVQWFGARPLAREYRLPFHWVETLGVRLYRHLVVLTPAMRERLSRLAPRARIAVVPNGVDDSLFEVAAPPGRSILYLGRLDLQRKGLGWLLEAYARLPAGARLPLVLAGHSDQEAAVRARVAELGLAGAVRLLGRVDAAQRRALLAESRFVCFPSPQETFGLVIAEACAAGRPVVHFDLPPMNEVASGAGCLAVQPFDVPAYAAAMQRLTDAPDQEIASRGAACRARVMAYRWDAVAGQQEAAYRAAVSRQAGRAAGCRTAPGARPRG